MSNAANMSPESFLRFIFAAPTPTWKPWELQVLVNYLGIANKD